MLKGNKELGAIIEEIHEKIEAEITLANRTGELEAVLEKYGYYENEDSIDLKYIDLKRAKVLLVADNRVKIPVLHGIMKRYDLGKKNLEFVDYAEAKSFNWSKLNGSTEYTDIFIGAMPHKVKGLQGSSSIIAKIEENPHNYPKLHKLTSGEELKISKTNFEKALISSELLRHFESL